MTFWRRWNDIGCRRNRGRILGGFFMEGVDGVVGVSLGRPSSPYFLLVLLVFTVTVFCDINTHRSTAKTSSCFASSTTSNLIVASMNFIFTAHMACVTRGGSSPLLIAVFEGGHFPGRTLPTRSKAIFVAL